MRSLHLNLLQPAPWQPKLTLLCAGLLLLCALLGLKLMQAEQQRAHPVHSVRPPPVLHVPAQDAALARTVEHAQTRIDIPWLALLSALESIQTPDIYWQTLAPEARQKRIHMTYLCKQRASGWAYLAQLKTLPMLTQVKVQSSTSIEQNGGVMVVFEVEALWQF